jgi:vancomycin permeability regulator SanA
MLACDEKGKMLNCFNNWRRIALLLTLIAMLMPPGLIALVHVQTTNRLYDNPGSVPARRVAVVFGAGVRPGGRLSPMLADRVQAAARLYHEGRAAKLLMTGDNSSTNYNEVEPMRRYAVELGVPARDITLDYAGFSTYESCYRARDIFGVRHAVLVTQRYHLPRAMYTCQQLGIEAVGLGTADWGVYHPALMTRYTLREFLATLNAMWQVHITRPQPTFLGPFEGIT